MSEISNKQIKALSPTVEILQGEIKRISGVSSEKTKAISKLQAELRTAYGKIDQMKVDSGRSEREKIAKLADSLNQSINDIAMQVDRARILIIEGEAKIKALSSILSELDIDEDDE